MIRIKAHYRDQKLELDQPLDLAEGAEVLIELHTPDELAEAEREAWSQLGMSRLEDEWDNPQDAIYDDWKKLYGV